MTTHLSCNLHLLNMSQDRQVPELIAATGSGHLGSFHLFQKDMPTRSKRKLHAIGGGRGLWSLRIRQQVKTGGATFERPSNPFNSDNDTVIISTDANPSPGLSRVCLVSSRLTLREADQSHSSRLPRVPPNLTLQSQLEYRE